MSWRRWKLGFGIAIFLGLLTAGAGLTDGMHWRGFIGVFCISVGGSLGNWLANHKVDDISFETEQFKKDSNP